MYVQRKEETVKMIRVYVKAILLWNKILITTTINITTSYTGNLLTRVSLKYRQYSARVLYFMHESRTLREQAQSLA